MIAGRARYAVAAMLAVVLAGLVSYLLNRLGF
jgi:hypothetical protein